MADKAEETEAPQKKSKIKIIVPAVVVILAIGGGGFYFMTSKSAKACPEATDTTETAAAVNGLPVTLASAAKEETKTEEATSTEEATTEEKATTESKTGSAEDTFAEKCAEEAAAALHGPIVRLTPITMNLSDGHILKVGLALQLIAEPKDEHLAAVVAAASAGGHGAAATEIGASPLGGAEAKALDTAINDLGNSTYEALSAPGGRAAAKAQLSAEIKEIYHGDVNEVFFTDFVMS